MKKSINKIIKSFLLAGVVIHCGLINAQNYPNKPIHFVVAFTAGSATDIIARAVGDVISNNIGQPVIIENKPGAGGTICLLYTSPSPRDRTRSRMPSSA